MSDPEFAGPGESVPALLYTIGHSTRALEELIDLLRTHGVELLVDVRSIPRSRHTPQFNRETLPAALGEAGIGYTHLAGLGGLRHSRPDSPNTGWKNASFRGYADYMQTAEFEQGITALIRLAESRRVALMCAEAVPWRCHRSLIADALLVRGYAVDHILGRSDLRRHALTPWARVDGLKLSYPPGG